MGKAIAGVIVGYITMFAVVFVGLSGAYFAMGDSGAYAAGTFEVSMAWIAVASVVGLVAAFLGAMVCHKISGAKKPVLVLAGLVFVLGIMMAIPTIGVEPPTEARTPDTPMMEAMMNSWRPAWTAFLDPILSLVGIGAFLAWRKPD